MRSLLVAISMAVALATGAVGSACASTTYTFTGEFDDISTSGNVTGLPADIVSGPVPFSYTFTTSSTGLIYNPGSGELTLGSSLDLIADRAEATSYHEPVFFAEFLTPFPERTRIWLFISHPVDSLFRTEPFGPRPQDFIVDETLLNSTYPLPLQASLIVRTAHPHWDGQEGLFSENFTSISVSGPAIAIAYPEPASWALLVLGFGSVGMSIRRRRSEPVRMNQ